MSASSETGTIATGKSPAGNTEYVGRFAPSPTGPLHFGSLLAAVASYLEARVHGGRWIVRIEDIDPPRAEAGAVESILEALERYGFEWDGPIVYQSRNRPRHEAAVGALLAAGLAYPCGCSRKELQPARQGRLGTIYPGTCRTGTKAVATAIRLRTDNQSICFQDALQGEHCQRLESESGDFVIRRKDGLIAYQLAVVVDDCLQGITDVVRGIDLMESTPRQIRLQELLGYPTPRYAHIPVAVNDCEQKLSKSYGASGIPLLKTHRILHDALAVLRQSPPSALREAPIQNIWSWAVENWNAGELRGHKQLAAPTDYFREARQD